jgi:hypothetical protein
MSVAPLPPGSAATPPSVVVIFIDGKLIGDALCTSVLPKIRELQRLSRTSEEVYAAGLVEVSSTLNAHDSMRQVTGTLPMLAPLLVCVLINNLRPSSAVDTASFDLLTMDQTTKIGTSFAATLATTTALTTAVDEWIVKYPALVELEAAHSWFRPLMENIAKRLLRDSSWGARYRLYFGAGMSILDMGSDIYVIISFLGTEGLENSGYNLLYLLITNIAFQLIVVFGQNRKGPMRHMLMEMLYVVTCTKVGVDAYRVASGAEQEVYNIFDPYTELGK